MPSVALAPERVVAGYQALSEAERDRVLAYLERLWAGLPDYSDATMARFAGTIAPVMEGAQRAAGVGTEVYLAALDTAATGATVAPAGVAAEATTTEAMRGVDARELWRRPAVTVYRALSEGLDPQAAGGRGLNRARSLAQTNLELAHTHVARAHLESSEATGYRRVVRGGASCALCLLASSQRYHKKKLMPIHPGCHCRVEPIYGEGGQAHVADPVLLADVKTALARAGHDVRALSRDDLRQLVVEHEHGEIGPVLGERGHSFTDLKGAP